MPVKSLKREKQERKRNPTWFQPGKSGNPNGRPKKENAFTDTAKELMGAKEINVEWVVNGRKKQLKMTSTKNIYYGLASALIMEGLKGNHNAIKELIDRTEGRAIQRVEGDVDVNVSIAEQIKKVWQKNYHRIPESLRGFKRVAIEDAEHR